MIADLVTVTEREVINGVLNVKNTKNHCLAYVRYINNINLQNLRKASLFLDIANRSLDNEASKLLADLRDERLPNKIESTNLQRYPPPSPANFIILHETNSFVKLPLYGKHRVGTPWNGSEERAWILKLTASICSTL